MVHCIIPTSTHSSIIHKSFLLSIQLSCLSNSPCCVANWIDLTNDGYLARVQCVEVWCPMTKEFYAQYIRHNMGTIPGGGGSSRHSNPSTGGGSSRLQRLFYTLNPRKFRSCEYLVKKHRERGDKIIIFRCVYAYAMIEE